MTLPELTKVLRKALPVALLMGWGLAVAEDAWVHGSWVNLRSAAAPTASVKAQLTTNAVVQLTARQGEWCAVRVASTAAEGYIQCSLLGSEPLTLAKTVSHPGRAFWIAPSVGRLMAYGSVLRSGSAYTRMFQKLQDGETARIQSLPEFDAAKRLMAAGVVPRPDAEIYRGDPVAPEAMEFFALLRPAPIQSSLFKSHGDIVLRSEGSADSLAAVAQSKITVKVTAPPVGYVNRHEGPEISGISGFGDVGEVELQFAPAILVYSLLPNGLVSAAHLLKQVPASYPEYGEGCGVAYVGSGVGLPTSPFEKGLDAKPVAGFPTLPGSMLPMASFVTAKPLAKKKLAIKSRSTRVPNLPKLKENMDGQEIPVSMTAPKVALHEVDFDGDGVADMLIWDAPSIGSMSGGYNLRRTWYLNIDGKWYAAGGMDDQECT